MKRPVIHHLQRASQVITISGLCMGLVSCETLPGGGGIPNLPIPSLSTLNPVDLPIHLSRQCVSLDATKEIVFGLKERPSIESSLDRVNTAARIIEVGGLILRTLPISGGSEWPAKVKGSVPLTEERILRQKLQLDPIHYDGAAVPTTALKLKALYLQNVLFEQYPDLSAPRKMGVADPTEAEVKALATKVLGPNSSPTFTKVFYRFLQYNPAFEPKAELFAGRIAGKATEVYPSLVDAVVSLAENKSEILQVREDVLQAEEKKEKERRDIAELIQRIQARKAKENGESTGGQEANAKEIEDLKVQLAVQKEEFKATVNAYQAELKKLDLEMSQIKTQMAAFDPEQRALAVNIQTAVDTVQGTLCQSEILLGLVGYHMERVASNWDQEVKQIAAQSNRHGDRRANERVKRLLDSVVALPTNLFILMQELLVLGEEAKVYDNLFSSRIQ